MKPIGVMVNAQAFGEEPPEWILVLPAGAVFYGRDGRTFHSPGAATVLAAQANQPDIPIDINHSELSQAPAGLPSPAYGWIKGYERRGDELWARVEWNQRGREAIKNREYRYHSPVYLPDSAGRIDRIHSVALVNRPNLELPALSNQEHQMKPYERIATALGLSQDATEDQVLAAVASRQSAEVGAAPAPPMVPKADFDLMANRVQTAENKLAENERDALRQEAEQAVDAAIAAGQASPVSRDYHLQNCSTPEGLASFKNYIKTAPVLGAPSKAPDGAPNAAEDARTPEDIEVSRQMGFDEEAKA